MQISDNVSAAAGHRTTTTTDDGHNSSSKWQHQRGSPRWIIMQRGEVEAGGGGPRKILMKAIVAKPRSKIMLHSHASNPFYLLPLSLPLCLWLPAWYLALHASLSKVAPGEAPQPSTQAAGSPKPSPCPFSLPPLLRSYPYCIYSKVWSRLLALTTNVRLSVCVCVCGCVCVCEGLEWAWHCVQVVSSAICFLLLNCCKSFTIILQAHSFFGFSLFVFASELSSTIMKTNCEISCDGTATWSCNILGKFYMLSV